MNRFVRSAVCATCGLLATLASMGASSGSLVASEINAIKQEPSVNARTEDARQLADQVRRNQLVVSDADIQLLAEMLSDRDDAVRYWIATTLGYLGPRAQQAAPALERALKDAQCAHGSKTSAPAIRSALANIGAPLRHLDCS
jgi:PBS lyase HEAT-like repeat